MKFLIVVDMQNDFITGALGTKEAEAILPKVLEKIRQAKPNDTYYLLLHVKSPIVIVECGFLSNWDEAARLNSTDYQDRLAWTLHMGILRYLNTRNCSVPSQLRAKIH